MWYVIHTMAGTEEKCLLQCEKYVDRTAYSEMFIPQCIEQRHFKKEWHGIQKTLFPGYLFVDTDEIEPVVEGLRKFRQYTRVLRDGDIISPVTKEEQAFLSGMMDENHVVGYSEGLLIGERVCITTGPLRKFSGYVRSVDRHRRIALLEIPFFGRATPVEVGFGAFCRTSEEEFHSMVGQNIRKYRKNRPKGKPGEVLVREGVFKGMTGKLLSADVASGEWTVELEIFQRHTKVTFQRGEIELFG